MSIPLTVTVSPLRMSLRLDAVLVLGNSYTLTWVGATGYDSPQLVLVDCNGNALATSSGDTLALNTQDLTDLFSPETCSSSLQMSFHLYAVAESTVIGTAQVFVRYSPVSFTADGTPATLKGDKGDTGAQGEQGIAGLSAYEVAVANGYEGNQEEWLASLVPTLDTHPIKDSTNGATSGGIFEMLDFYAGKIPVNGSTAWQAVEYVLIGDRYYLRRVGEPQTPPWLL
jgi:hypothetical protein